MSKKTTMRDVAEYAGVSKATVSYVLNDVKKVSEETKEKVLQAIKELNYSPDFTAISLSKKRSMLIGIILPLINESLISVMKENTYYNEMLSGIELVARQNNFDILISGIGKIEEYRNWVQKRNLDGLLFLGLFPESLYTEMKNIDVPTVLIDTYEEYTDIYPNVNIKDELGGYLAVQHLIQLGHRHIAFVGTNNESPVDKRRFEGYRRALQEAGISLNDQLIFEVKDHSFENGFKIGEKILKSQEKITAIFSISDILAIGMISSLHQHQKRVPEDYSIVGFDDISASQYIVPSLTTVKQNIVYKGQVATDLLIDIIEKRIVKPKKMELDVELVVRNSTKKVR
ncbi:LacI family DNA-binding transcriptional regulator [Caldalkalibacillus mannanilyticus]|uniref:LacI family DNA-binding transcriptional regulator n=1 Tax=Caldalkalibacillus mannanilyticus TaxID=1418 RepID=UPI00046A95CA|nr:LacI family DNA-binding transcriptional regulator [Caldalkalibacillus mannanilyticus]